MPVLEIVTDADRTPLPQPPVDSRALADSLVTLIRPPRISSTRFWSLPFTVPLGLGYLAAVLRQAGVPVRVLDALAESHEQIEFHDGYRVQGLSIAEIVDRVDGETRFIGVSCMFSQDWLHVRQLLSALRERFPHAVIIAGGEHATAVSESLLRSSLAVDLCVRGEGEETMLDVVTRPANEDSWRTIPGLAFLSASGEYIQTPARQRIRDVDAIPWPAWDLLPVETYLDTDNMFGVNRGRTIGVLATRGCPYQCTFCSNPQMYGKVWEARDPNLLLDEMEHCVKTYGIENFDFYDLTMVLKREWILEFTQAIDRRGLKFYWQLPAGTRAEIIDDEVAKALYEHGCLNLTFAPESGSARILKDVKKKVDLSRMESAIRAALRQKIRVKLNVIMGFPNETRGDLWKTILWCWKMAVIGVDAAETNLFSPYPGTELFDELRKTGDIGDLTDDYYRSLMAFQDPFRPSPYSKHVSAVELAFLRSFNMITFFMISFALRPIRLFRLVPNVLRNRSETVLEHRLGVWFHQFARRFFRRSRKPIPAVEPDAVA